jgi:hypothetical protein
MASINNLLISWNFDTVTGSNNNGTFFVDDIIGTELGSAVNFSTSSADFILKEDLKTNKKLKLETLEGSETIMVRDEDDIKTSLIKKPEAVTLLIENSMYQLISDEMLNLFSTVSAYAFQYTEASNKYRYEYLSKNDRKLKTLRRQFFDKILNKPDLEKYVEFYKWIDNSLGDLLKQLIPESSNSGNGLKITIEDHILERSKFTHKLPLTTKKNPFYSKAITVYKTDSTMSGSSFINQVSATIDVNNNENQLAENVLNRNFSETHEYFQTAGKSINNRGNKTNKTVFRTVFSAGDGLSERNRDTTGEYSSYNGVARRALEARQQYNVTQSITGSNYDNNFIYHNIPYVSSSFDSGSYISANTQSYQAFPNKNILFNKQNNILIEDELIFVGQTLADSVTEPVIEFNIPAKHTIRVPGALEDSLIYSPYSNFIDLFTPRLLNERLFLAEQRGITNYFDELPSPRSDVSTFTRRWSRDFIFTIKKFEILENLFPRKDLVTLDLTRKKFSYEEVYGSYANGRWSNNSYNNNSALIRSFWKDSAEDRKRARGLDIYSGGDTTGSLNCFDKPNISASIGTNTYVSASLNGNTKTLFLLSTSSFGSYTDSIFTASNTYEYYTNLVVTGTHSFYDSIFCLDSEQIFSSSYQLSGAANRKIPTFSIQNNVLGDLTPLPHNVRANIVLNKTNNTNFRAKPEFVFNNFLGYLQISAGGIYGPFNLYINKSYQEPIDPRIIPFYNSYDEFSKNIKHKSQDHSIIPEFAISNFDEIINGQIPSTSSYLKILGRERYNELTTTYNVERENQEEHCFYADFKFKNLKSNKIKFKVSAIKKLLPYNGFYPSQRSVQIVKYFGDTYFNGLTELEKQYTLQPLFAPGILFNTIKAGIAMPWHRYTFTENNSGSLVQNLLKPNYDEFVPVGTTLSYGTNFSCSVVSELNDNLLPFETLLEPDNYLISGSLKYLAYHDPTHYSNIFSSGTNISNFVIPAVEIEKLKQNQNNYSNNLSLYKYSINNYLSEIPNFFLKNKQLTYFATSAPESQFEEVTANTNYDLKLTIIKNNNFSMFKKTANSTVDETFLFGPPVRDNYLSGNIFNTSSYAAFAPPYYLSSSKSTNDISFNEIVLRYRPTTTHKPSLSEIFNKLQVLNADYGTNISLQYASSNFSSSLLLTEALPNEIITRDPVTDVPISAELDKTNNRWAIQTKFETPLIDFTDSVTTSSTTIISDMSQIFVQSSSTGITESVNTTSYKVNTVSFQGIWNSYGSIPKDGESVQLKISDEGIENSLLKIVKFQSATKSIGALADAKTISEAIVILPYAKRSVDSSNEVKSDYEPDKFLFRIDKNVINNLLKVPDYTALSIEQIKQILDNDQQIDRQNSIVNLMTKMVNYNLPPHLNWLFNADSKIPFVMYIVDFNHILAKQDLADIWQGTMPDISKNPEQETIEIEHYKNSNELFGNIDLTKYDIGLKIFKIKKRANTDYRQITLNPIDTNTTKIPWYTHNWPYDYFSLIELVNIQGGEAYERIENVIAPPTPT